VEKLIRIFLLNKDKSYPPPPTIFMKQAEKPYTTQKAKYPKVDQTTVQYLSEILGIPSEVLMYWKLDPTIPNAIGGSIYLTSLLQDTLPLQLLFPRPIIAGMKI
jgi:hypothetical protein